MLVDSNLDGALSFEELSKILGNIKVRRLDFCDFRARSAWISSSKGHLDWVLWGPVSSDMCHPRC